MTPRLILLGIAGRKHAGKTTVAEAMARRARLDGYAVMQRGCSELVAGEVAQVVAQRVGTTPEQAYRLLMSAGKEAYRPLLQQHGAGQRERHGDDYWLTRMAGEVERFAGSAAGRRCVFVIGGIRYRNEADWIRGEGGSVLRVQRPGRVDAADAHITERDLDAYERYNHVLVNDASLTALERKIDALWGDLSDFTSPPPGLRFTFSSGAAARQPGLVSAH